MLKTLVRVALVSVCALPIMTASEVSAQDWARDNSCAVTGQSTKQTLTQVTKWIRKKVPIAKAEAAQGTNLVASGYLTDGPICNAKSQEERLLLTGIMMDRAALSAAKGIDAAQMALGRKRTLEGRISELERALNGLGSGNPNATEIIIKEVSAESIKIAEALGKLKDSKALDDDARARLADAQRSLHEVTYYDASAAAGAKLFTDFINSGKSTTKLYAALTSPKIGFGSEFATQLPERASKLPESLGNTVSLKKTISRVVAEPESADAGEQRAKELAVKDAERLQKSLQSMRIATTPI